MSFYLVSESCGLQVRRFRNVLIGRHRNRMKPYEKQEQMFYHYSHSIIANLKYMLYRVILLLLFQEVPCRANHFVIGRGDYKMRFLLPFHLICDYSLATTPIFTKGSGHRWFSTGAHAVSDTAIGGCKPCALGGFLPDYCQERKAENILFMG